MELNKILTVTFTLFAVIDIIGSIPVLIAQKNKTGQLNSWKVTLASGVLMLLFLYAGRPILKVMNLDVHSFAVGGSIVMFLVGLEMVLGLDIFKEEPGSTGTLVPIAFPLIAGTGTLTTIMSLKANFEDNYILMGILINLVIIFIALHLLKWLEKILGKAGLIAIRKFFGVILLAIAVKIFGSSLQAFGK
ncbi:MarC family protein [Parafilimonas sp.]|jgi:multiple antibiotic resistance protein|uniref:MarC family protein n=1 Tax=Parafilimonas sp. TaxID=1969739 RepID=UPI003F8082FE